MTALPHGDLPGLVRGELPTDDVAEMGDHLGGCESCRQSLVDTVVGHALLARSARTLGADALEAAPPAPLTVPREARLPRRQVPYLKVVGVVAALVAAGGVGAATQSQLGGGTGTPAPQRSATLRAVSGDGSGTVSMTEADGTTSMTISTHDLPAARPGQFYYAWLLDPKTNKMLPLGQVGPSGTASFEVSDRLLAAYAAVDVSLEDDDGDPQHSPTSVLRASYA